MKDAAPQSTYEKLVAALLVVGMIVIGWGPYGLAAMKLPFVDRFLVPMTMTFTVLSLGMIYDAAERFLGRGRGIYAAAIFCSFPATGLTASDPSALPTAALMLMVAVGIWMAVRATGEERPFFLGMIGVLLLAAGFFFRGDFRAFAFFFVAGLAAYQIPAELRTKRAEAGTLSRHMGTLSAGLILLYVAGAAAGELFTISVPLPQPVPVPLSSNMWRYVLPWLPWTIWLIPLIVAEGRPKAESWKFTFFSAIILLIPTAIFRTKYPAATAAIAAPLLAFVTADWIHEEFVTAWTKHRRILRAIPAVLTGLLLWALAVLAATPYTPNKELTLWHVAVAVVAGAGLLWTTWRNLPRWSFVLLFAAGVVLGRMISLHDPLFPTDEPPPLIPLFGVLGMIGAACALGIAAYLLRKKYEHTGEPEEEMRFAEENARDFSNLKRRQWEGIPVMLAQPSDRSNSFVIFGDVTGAESPLSARRGGYFAFRALTRVLRETKPGFAISIGDLASHATTGSYRKLRKLLGQIPVPLVVAPGNHDLFDHTVYNAAHFHALFGADNGSFQWGPVKVIVLNNAWGSIADEQFTWLEKTLATSSPCTLVFCHKPPFDSREHTFYGMEERPHAEKLHELFRLYKVSAVFSGHIHTLQRSEKDGVTYVVSGGGGSKLSSSEDQFHYLSARLAADALVIQALPLAGKSGTPLLELRFSI
jgi:hypothetical protein